MDYCHIDIYEVQEMEIDVYLFFMREAMIFENSKTGRGTGVLRELLAYGADKTGP